MICFHKSCLKSIAEVTFHRIQGGMIDPSLNSREIFHTYVII